MSKNNLEEIKKITSSETWPESIGKPISATPNAIENNAKPKAERVNYRDSSR